MSLFPTAALFSGRALTVRNPWPFAIHHLDKGAPGIGCENRVKPPPAWLVGPDAPFVAMHTGAHRATRAELILLEGQARAAGWEVFFLSGDLTVYRKGEREITRHDSDSMISLIPGVFRILSVDAPGEGDLTGWRFPDQYGYRIDYRPLPVPIPCVGSIPKEGRERGFNLGWWRVPVDVCLTIEAAIAVGASR